MKQATKSSRAGRERKPGGRAGGRGISPLVWLVAILAVTFVVYLPCLGNGWLNWDDNAYVTENSLLVHPSADSLLTTQVAGNHHPLTIASLLLNYKISGLDPQSYHWLNLLLHLANTALVFFFVRALAGRPRLWVAVATSLFFGVHPTHVESVAWVSERKDVLYAFFYLIALVLYLRYLDAKKALWLGLAWVAFVLSCASKPAAVVLPVTLFLVDGFRRRPLTPRATLEKVPFFLVSLAVGLWTLEAQHSVGAVAGLSVWSPMKRVLFASYGTVLYFVKLFLPFRLSAVYPLPALATRAYPWPFYAAPFLVAAILAGMWLLRRQRWVVFGIAFFFVNIVLVLQLVTVGAALIADRYTYVPYIGLFFALAWWLDEPRSALRGPIAALLAILLPICLVQTWNRCAVWHDPETFWNDTIAKYPHKIVDAYYNRANYYHKKGRVEEALRDYRESIVLNPGVVRAWYNKGILLAETGQNDSALVAFDQVLKIDPKQIDALNNRGAMQFRAGNFPAAAADFERVIGINPRYRDSYANLALAYLRMREFAKAIDIANRGLLLDPNNTEFYLSRSEAWFGLHENAKALADVRAAEKLEAKVNPDYVRRLGSGGG